MSAFKFILLSLSVILFLTACAGNDSSFQFLDGNDQDEQQSRTYSVYGLSLADADDVSVSLAEADFPCKVNSSEGANIINCENNEESDGAMNQARGAVNHGVNVSQNSSNLSIENLLVLSQHWKDDVQFTFKKGEEVVSFNCMILLDLSGEYTNAFSCSKE